MGATSGWRGSQQSSVEQPSKQSSGTADGVVALEGRVR